MSVQNADDATSDEVDAAVAASDDVTEDSFPSSESGDLGSRSDEEFLRAAVAVPEVTPPTEEPDRIGTELGHFEVREVLGRGGMGIVYGANDTKLGRRVALKVLPAGVASDTDRRGRLLREARAASAVSHPNIAAVYEVGEADGHIYIAMERVEGQTLRKRIEKGTLPPEEAVRIVREIARALVKAHAAGIVHRDLKPDNVMVGAEGLVKILDRSPSVPVDRRSSRPRCSRRWRVASWAPRATCRPSRPRANKWTPAAICSRSACCSTKCSAASGPSRATAPWKF